MTDEKGIHVCVLRPMTAEYGVDACMQCGRPVFFPLYMQKYAAKLIGRICVECFKPSADDRYVVQPEAIFELQLMRARQQNDN